MMNRGKLPVTEVEYLESTGTQYIDLPMTVAAGTFFSLEFEIIPVYIGGSRRPVLTANPYAQFYVGFWSYNSTTDYITYNSIIGGKVTNGGFGFNVGTKHTVILSTDGITRDGVFTENKRALGTTITAFRIFMQYGGTQGYPVKIGHLKITAGDDVLYDLIPFRIGNIGCMYDKVSDQLLNNNGTGRFIPGPDV